MPRGYGDDYDDYYPDDGGFADIPADENDLLRSVPWWAISAAFHALLLLAIWSIVMAEDRTQAPRSAPAAIEPQELPEPPKIKPQTILPEERDMPDREDPTDDPKITKVALDDRNEDPTNDPNEDLRPNPNPDDSNVKSPYPNQGFNSSIGLGGNVGGGGGPGGKGGLVHLRARGQTGGHPGQRNVIEALYWLRDHQNSDGSWSPENFMAAGRANGRTAGAYGNADGSTDTGWPQSRAGLTGLAALAFLGAGYTHKEGEFKRTVKSALRYLKRIQDDDGCFGSRDDHHFTYNHAICSMAMSEAYAMTGSAHLKAPAQRGVDFIARAQNQDPDRGYLGWRYGVKPGDSDSSVTGWMVLALKSARLANLKIPEACWEGARRHFDDMTGENLGYPKTGYITKGGSGARLRGSKYKLDPSIDAINVLVRRFLGTEARDPVLRGQAGVITEPDNLPTVKDPLKVDYYYWYYASLAMFQMGGRYWKAWEDPMIEALTTSQDLEGDRTFAKYGSWDSTSAWGVAGGRVYATAINALTLEVYYRYEFIGANRRHDK